MVERLEMHIDRIENFDPRLSQRSKEARLDRAIECLMLCHMLAGHHPYLDFKIWMGEEAWNAHIKKIEEYLKNDK